MSNLRVLALMSFLCFMVFVVLIRGVSNEAVGVVYLDSFNGTEERLPRFSVVGRGPNTVFLSEELSEELVLQRRLFLEDSRIPDAEHMGVERVLVGVGHESIVEKVVTPYGPSGFTLSEIDNLLMGSPLEGLGSIFLDVESEYGVSAAFLVAVAKQESNLGRSRLGRDKKNLFGYAAYDRDPYGSAHAYSSYESCIRIVSERIATNYLSVGGKYYRGGTIKAIGSLWASDPGWAGSVEAIYRGYIVE